MALTARAMLASVALILLASQAVQAAPVAVTLRKHPVTMERLQSAAISPRLRPYLTADRLGGGKNVPLNNFLDAQVGLGSFHF